MFADHLPLTAGPFGLEFVQAEEGGVEVLKFFGLERWRGSPDREPFVDELRVLVPTGPHAKVAVRTWALVVRDVLTFAASWPLETEQWLGAYHLRFELPKKRLGTEDAWLAHWRDAFRELLPVSAELRAAADVVSRVLAADGTLARTDQVSLVAVAFPSERYTELDRGVRVRLQLTISEAGQIRDIKEQDCVLVDRGDLSPARVEAFVAGWREALQRLFEQRTSDLETLMPHDLLEDALELARPQTKDDFRDVMLRRWKLL